MELKAFDKIVMSIFLTGFTQLSEAQNMGTHKGTQGFSSSSTQKLGYGNLSKEQEVILHNPIKNSNNVPLKEPAKKTSNYSFNGDHNKTSQIQKGGGGADTGGGNAIGSRKVYPSDITRYLKNAKSILPYILRKLEFISSAGSIKDETGIFHSSLAKLFKGKKTIYQATQEAELIPLEKGACLDTDGKEVDASAKDAPKLCFSLERLSEKLNEDSVQSETLAIVVHELSHMVGTSENEAYFLQSVVKMGLTNDAYNKIPTLITGYQQKIKDVLDSTTYMLELLPYKKAPQLCTFLPSIMPATNEVIQRNMNALNEVGIPVLPLKSVWTLYSTLIKSMNLMSFCLEQGSSFEKINEAFKGRKEIPLIELYTAVFQPNNQNGGQIPPLPNIVVRNLQTQDLNALKLELQDIQTSLSEVLGSL